MKKLIKIEEICSIVLFLMILMILFWQIFSRKVLNAPASWSEELSRLLFVYMGILGCHLAQHYETHIRIDFILSHFPKLVQTLLDIVFKLLMSVVFILIAYNGIRLCRSAGVPGDTRAAGNRTQFRSGFPWYHYCSRNADTVGNGCTL